jgi:hypothetical protein
VVVVFCRPFSNVFFDSMSYFYWMEVEEVSVVSTMIISYPSFLRFFFVVVNKYLLFVVVVVVVVCKRLSAGLRSFFSLRRNEGKRPLFTSDRVDEK